MVSVGEAASIILQQRRDYGNESLPLRECLGRALAEDIRADRDMPPFNRVAMDGIAIRYDAYERGIRTFRVKAIQAAGEPPKEITGDDECIEIMTGAVLPASTDTIVPYEALELRDRKATIKSEEVTRGRNVHAKGKDRTSQEVLARAGQLIDSSIITVASAVGKGKLLVKKAPRVVIISTGDELIDVDETPERFQIRRSNNYALSASLREHALDADMLHLPDDPKVISEKLNRVLQDYDVILLSGGVSMGKFDFVPDALGSLNVEKLFHKVQQRPGKPFWFGTHPSGTLVFAFPGNPVSAFMCFHRYFLPWLKACWGVPAKPRYAILSEDFTFKPSLQYFLPVRIDTDASGRLFATPAEGNGSGDFANLLDTDAFLELPMERDTFWTGEAFPIWPFKPVV